MRSLAPDDTRPDTRAEAAPRAWSRAGAIAAVLATRPAARVGSISARVALFVAGVLLISVAVAVMLWTGFGPGPLDVFIGAVRVRTGLPLGVTVWLVIGSLIALAWALGRRPGPGTVIAPLLMGPIMQGVVTLLDPIEAPDQLVVQAAVHLVAIAAVGIGAGALIVSGLGAGSGELLAIAASDRTGRPEPRVRLVVECSLLVVGVLLGGPIGLGTVLVAAAIGPAVATGDRVVRAAVGTATITPRVSPTA